MYLFTLILAVVLFPQAHTLNCHSCTEGTACTQKQCQNDSHQCGALRNITYHGQSKVSNVASRGCFPPDQCIKGSMNFGVKRVVVIIECCNTNLCNKDDAQEPKTNPNGKKCYRCDGKSNCTGTLNCEGDENSCIKVSVTGTGQTQTLKGCATKSMCSAMNKAAIPDLGGTVSCCEGNFCNGAEGARASFLLLTTMLISIFFFSNSATI